ncbi:MAG: glycosyltransferase [Pseudomonadota bacterium]
MKDASIVIPHYRDVDRLRRCLEALARSTEAALSRAEVVVVDNTSGVDLSWVEQDYPFARLVTESEQGAACARNRGVHETTAPRIAFLDSDCVPRGDWLTRVLDVALADEGEVKGGEITTFDETPPPRSGAEAFEAVFAFDQRSYVEDKGFTVTANMVFERALFERVGELTNGLSEDVEWCRRAVAKGAVITYDPGLSVSHPTRGDWPSLRKKWLRTTREGYGTELANRGAWIRKALLMPLSAVAHGPRVLLSPRLNGPGERLRGLFTLFRLRLVRGWWMLVLAWGGNPR